VWDFGDGILHAVCLLLCCQALLGEVYACASSEFQTMSAHSLRTAAGQAGPMPLLECHVAYQNIFLTGPLS